MLKLSRKTGQSIEIDGGITVQILKSTGNTVRVGIEAPESVGVWRSEAAPLESVTTTQIYVAMR